jgi:hypothetical protein
MDFEARAHREAQRRIPPRNLLRAASRLGAVADFLVITSNGAHLVQDAVERAAGKKVLSMIDVTLDEVRRRGWARIGVITLGDPLVYTRRLDPLGIACETPAPERQEPLARAFFRLAEGREDDEDRRLAREEVERLRGTGRSVSQPLTVCDGARSTPTPEPQAVGNPSRDGETGDGATRQPRMAFLEVPRARLTGGGPRHRAARSGAGASPARPSGRSDRRSGPRPWSRT